MAELVREDVLNLIREQVKLCGYSQKAVAFDFGVSQTYLSDILRYKRPPGASVLKAMGLKKRVTYIKDKGG